MIVLCVSRGAAPDLVPGPPPLLLGGLLLLLRQHPAGGLLLRLPRPQRAASPGGEAPVSRHRSSLSGSSANVSFLPSRFQRLRSTSPSSASRCRREEVNYKTAAFGSSDS